MLLFSFQLLIEKELKNRFFLAFGKLLVLNVFSIQILIQKVLKNCFFTSFAKILVLDVVFSSNSN